MGIVGWFGKIATGRCYSFHQNHEREDLQWEIRIDDAPKVLWPNCH
jgi:hypothetical protein